MDRWEEDGSFPSVHRRNWPIFSVCTQATWTPTPTPYVWWAVIANNASATVSFADHCTPLPPCLISLPGNLLHTQGQLCVKSSNTRCVFLVLQMWWKITFHVLCLKYRLHTSYTLSTWTFLKHLTQTYILFLPSGSPVFLWQQTLLYKTGNTYVLAEGGVTISCA